MNDRVRLDPSWMQRLAPALTSPTMRALRQFLIAEGRAGKRIFPPPAQIFAALDATSFDQVKVVILGQDPYHGLGQAHGLCFSVQPGTPPPPSLKNIFAELRRDLSIEPVDHGCLTPWARQGVLLLNTVLTVEQGRPASHQGRGWESFTDAVVAALAQERSDLVFLLWGAHAQSKARSVDVSRHLLLKAPHPSPLSAYRGFIGCGHFSLCNQWLLEHQQSPVDWQLPAVNSLA